MKKHHKNSSANIIFAPRVLIAYYFIFGIGCQPNAPDIIKYLFWKMAYENINAVYVCINFMKEQCSSKIKR